MLSRTRALPPYLLAEIDDLKWKLRREGRDVIDLCLGSPDLPPPPAAVEALVASLSEKDASRYMPSPGLPELQQAEAEWYRRRYGVELDPASEIAVTLGSKEGIGHLLLALLDPGEVAIVPTPSYPAHHWGAVIAGAATVSYPVAPGLDPVAEVRAAIARAPSRPKVLIVNYPHNPTTAICDAAQMRALAELAAAEDLVLLSDIAYADLCFDGFVAPSLLAVPGSRSKRIEFTSLSKGRSMAGWRVGFCAGDRELVGALKTIKRYTDYGHFKPIQRGAIAFDKSANDRYVVTFHDSCNVARASRMGGMPGGQFEIPRAIVRAVANKFVEMYPDSIREKTFCCGGGGGLLSDDLLDLRVKGALPRMEALQAVVDSDGVNFMATICAICKAQFSKVLPYYKFNMSMVGGVHQLVGNAIRLGPK